MNILTLPWLEIAIAASVVGAFVVVLMRDPLMSYRWSLVFTGISLAASTLEWLAHALGVVPDPGPRLAWPEQYLGLSLFAVDELTAPLLPLVALLHFLTALSTARTKMGRFAFDGMLVSSATRLAAFGCKVPWLMIALVIASVIPTYIELLARRKPTRVFVLHMVLFTGLLICGWACIDGGSGLLSTTIGPMLLLGAILVRCGTAPAHCWVTDLFENASFGNSLLYMTPLTGIYLAVRLVLPIAPGWVLSSIGVVSLLTAVYAAGMATVQKEARRFFAYLFISHTSLVLVGLELVTAVSLTGALALWFSVALGLGGLGLTLRALEARWGKLSMASHQGLYEQSPSLAMCFLLTGLAAVGFPGTLGFIATELLVDGAIHANLAIGLGVILASALNGIAIVRAYFLLFTGTKRAAVVPLGITLRERVAVLTLAALILGGGLFPQYGVRSRHNAAEALLAERKVEPAQKDH